jgi:pimeloyl-ACP methyl ester carboxylesterase
VVELEQRSAVLGHSLGAAAACQFAARHAVARVVLVSPFTELRAMARRSVGWPLCWLLRGNFDNRARLAEITARTPAPPVVILHGDDDEVIPVAMGRTLAAELGDRCRYQEIAGADHNGILGMAESQIWAAMQADTR